MIDSVDALIEQLKRYVYKVAYNQTCENRLNVLLEFEDIVSELTIELIKCWQTYGEAKDDDELLKLAKTMISNRMRELIYTYHKTHRRNEASNGSLDSIESIVADPSSFPGRMLESKEHLRQFLLLLTPEEEQVVQVIMDPNNKRMRLWVKMYSMRRSAAYCEPTIKITADLVADALHMEYDEARVMFRSIKKKWREIYGR